VRIVRGVRRHALPFWRCWNRPMESVWRLCFFIEFILLVYNAPLGLTWLAYSIFLFTATVILWTCETVRQYRKESGRNDGPPGGDRFEVHDRHDIFRRFPWQ
jgi:hypothetical protein